MPTRSLVRTRARHSSPRSSQLLEYICVNDRLSGGWCLIYLYGFHCVLIYSISAVTYTRRVRQRVMIACTARVPPIRASRRAEHLCLRRWHSDRRIQALEIGKSYPESAWRARMKPGGTSYWFNLDVALIGLNYKSPGVVPLALTTRGQALVMCEAVSG